jgi:hypothetical protein
MSVLRVLNGQFSTMMFDSYRVMSGGITFYYIAVGVQPCYAHR